MRRQAGMDLVELRIVVTIILLLSAISLPLFQRYVANAAPCLDAVKCLGRLAADPHGTCPSSGKAFVEAGGGRACPDPHVDPAATLVAGTFKQALPPALEAPEVEGSGSWIRVETRGKVLIARVRNNAWSRWLGGPLLAVLGFGMLSLAGELYLTKTKYTWIGSVLGAVAALAVMIAFHQTETFEIDPARGQVMRASSCWGIGLGSAVHEGVAGIVALKSQGAHVLFAVPKGGPALRIAALPDAALGLAARLQTAFEGR